MEFERKDPPPVRTKATPDEHAWKPLFVAFLKEHQGEWYVGQTIQEDAPKGRGNINQTKLNLEKANPGVTATVRTEVTSDTDDTKVIRLYGMYVEPETITEKEEDHVTAGERVISSENVMPGRFLKVGGLVGKVESVVPNGTSKVVYLLQIAGAPKKQEHMTITLAKKLPITLEEDD